MPSVSAIGGIVACFFCATPNSTRQRNSSPVTTPCLRATLDTLTPGWSLSSAIVRFCSSLKKRRTGCGTGSGSSFVGFVNRLSASNLLAQVPAIRSGGGMKMRPQVDRVLDLVQPVVNRHGNLTPHRRRMLTPVWGIDPTAAERWFGAAAVGSMVAEVRRGS